MPSVITGARLFTGDTFLDGHGVLIDHGRITALMPEAEAPAGAEQVTLDGGLLAPGFIDTQVNGGGGVLFNATPEVAGLQRMVAAHRRYGSTGLIPTLISDHLPVMAAGAEAVRSALAGKIPGIRGIHFEGPYLNAKKRGVHAPDRLRPFEEDFLQILTAGDLGVVMVTLAPEMQPPGTVRRLADRGVKVCAGHTDATAEDIAAALQEGLCGFTHLYNAMSALHHREPGVVGAALADARSWCGLIVDGHHVHPVAAQIAINAKPRGKIMLVTDAMPTVGAEDKRYTLYGEEIRAESGRLATGDGTLAGSDLDMASAVRNCVTLLEVPLDEALRMASLYPAQFLGLDRQIGRLEKGYDADLVWLDDDLRCAMSWIGGAAMRHDR